MYTDFTSKKKIVFSYKARFMWSCDYCELLEKGNKEA